MKASALFLAALAVCLLGAAARAVDCGTDGWCPCPSGGRCLGGHATCEEACGLTRGVDTSARDAFILRQQAQAAAEQAAARQREEERRAREAQEERERQEQFIRDRDAGVEMLRGLGTKATANSAGPELRGDTRVDTGIRELAPAKETRDLLGTKAAWKQLNCAAGIAGYAFGALNVAQKSGPSREPDFDEFNYLSGEAIHALNGETLGVKCPAGAPAPRAYGPEAAVLYKHKYVQLLEHSQVLAETLSRTIAERKEARVRVAAAKKRAAAPAPEPVAEAAPSEAKPAESPAAKDGKPEKKKIDIRAAALAAAREAERLEQELAKREDETRKELTAAQELAEKIQKGDPAALKRLEGERKP